MGRGGNLRSWGEGGGQGGQRERGREGRGDREGGKERGSEEGRKRARGQRWRAGGEGGIGTGIKTRDKRYVSMDSVAVAVCCWETRARSFSNCSYP